MLAFLSLNGIEIDCTELELFSLFMGLAASNVAYNELVDWTKNHFLTKEDTNDKI